MRTALLVATVVVPLQTALLHGWIYLHRRHEAVHRWIALAALGVAGMALSVLCRVGAAPPAVRTWQEFEMACGAALLIGFVRWLHAFLGVARPFVDRLALGFAVVLWIGAASGAHFGGRIAMQPALGGGAPLPQAELSLAGIAGVAGYGAFSAYIGVALVMAWRTLPRVRVACVAYGVFAMALFHDIAVGARWLDGPQLVPVGYLIMVIGLSAEIVRKFVRSMESSERLASDLSASVAERGAELARKERQLVHAERLAALGTLAAALAHEINDPLAFVSSSLNRIEEAWSEPAERRDVPEILAECHDGLARLRGTVGELLRLARRRESEIMPIDLVEVVSSVLPLVRAEGRFRARWTEILTAVPRVRADAGLLAQVALQLLLNALRSVPEGAPADHHIQVSTACEGERVFLRVHDSGPPIPAAELPHLFDPFATIATDHDAPRLGLAVTHQIVASHGGDIAVESDACGTLVSVSFPVDESETAA